MLNEKLILLKSINDCCLSYKKKLMNDLADHISVASEEIFYAWCRREIRQSGILSDYYRYFFHGYECDFRGIKGEYIRIEFGSGGRYDSFTTFGLCSFAMSCLSGFVELYPEMQQDDYLEEVISNNTSFIKRSIDLIDPSKANEFDINVGHRLVIVKGD